MRKAICDEVGNRAGTLALIIDDDNATPKIVKGLLAEIVHVQWGGSSDRNNVEDGHR